MISMITDRNASDVENAGTLRLMIQSGQTLSDAEKMAFERGACTVTMLNRIENAQKDIAERLNKYAYTVSIINKTWTNAQIFGYADCLRLTENADKLKNAFYTYGTTPETPGYIYGYKGANDIEKILEDIDALISDMMSKFRECGTFYCGEVNEL